MGEKNLVFINLLGKVAGVSVLHDYDDTIKTKIYNTMGFVASFEYAAAYDKQLVYGTSTRKAMFPSIANNESYDGVDMIYYFHCEPSSYYTINRRRHSVKRILSTDYDMFLQYCESCGCMFLISPSVDEVREIPGFRADKPKNRWFCYDWEE